MLYISGVWITCDRKSGQKDHDCRVRLKGRGCRVLLKDRGCRDLLKDRDCHDLPRDRGCRDLPRDRGCRGRDLVWEQDQQRDHDGGDLQEEPGG